MVKKTITMILLLVLVLLFTGTALAASPQKTQEDISSDVGLRFTYISSTFTNLVINASGKASCAARIDAYDGVDSVTVSAYLEKYDDGWESVKHWSESYSGTYYAMQKTWYVTEGYYRLRAYYYAYDGDNSESVSDTVYWDY